MHPMIFRLLQPRYPQDEFLSVVKQVNRAREVVMMRVVETNSDFTEKDLPRIKRVFAKLNREKALPGEKFRRRTAHGQAVAGGRKRHLIGQTTIVVLLLAGFMNFISCAGQKSTQTREGTSKAVDSAVPVEKENDRKPPRSLPVNGLFR